MLDDFDHRRRVESAEPAVAIHQRTVHQANAFALLRRQPIELEARFRQIEYSAGHVHADDLSELVIGEEAAQELALAATEIEDARSARSLQHLEHRVEPAFVEADRPLDRRFLFVLLGRGGLFLGLFLRRQPGDGVANEPSLMHQIARDDGIARRMAVEPALAVTKQLLDLVVPNPVVLLIVENRNRARTGASAGRSAGASRGA